MNFNYIEVHMKALEKNEANTSRRSVVRYQLSHGYTDWQEIIKLRAEINQLETKRTIQRINETKSWFFEKINKIGKPVVKLKDRASTQINKIKK